MLIEIIRKFKIVALSAVAFISGCCDDCDTPPIEPCFTVSLGVVKNSDFILGLGLFKKQYQSFTNNIHDDTARYYENKIYEYEDSIAEFKCDTTYFYRQKSIRYNIWEAKPKDAPFFSFTARFIKDMVKDTMTEVLTIYVSGFQADLVVNADTLYSLSSDISVEYVDSLKLSIYNDHILRNVYHLKRIKDEYNVINDVFLSLEKGVMACYERKSNYWVRL